MNWLSYGVNKDNGNRQTEVTTITLRPKRPSVNDANCAWLAGELFNALALPWSGITCQHCIFILTSTPGFNELGKDNCKTGWVMLNSSHPGQNGHHFTDNIFRCIFVNEKFCISIKISLKFVPKGPIDNNAALAPVPLSIFQSNSKFDENSKHSSVKYTRPITTIFCTRHDSVTVVTCAKYRCDRSSIFETRAFW